MFILEKSDITMVTGALAEQFLTKNNYPGQRPKRPRIVEQFKRKMRENKFLPKTAHIVLGRLGNTEYLMNGQHVCTAIVEESTKISCIVQKYKCETREDLADLFQSYDRHLQRTLRDLIHSETDGLKKPEWTLRLTSLFVTGLVSLYGLDSPTNGEKGRSVKDMKLEKLGEHIVECDHVHSILKGYEKQSRHLLRAAVCHAMILSFQKKPQIARRFWIEVRDGGYDGETLAITSPTHLLRDFLKDHVVQGSGFGDNIAKKGISSRQMTATCILHWNAYRTNTPVKKYHYGVMPVMED